MMKTLRYGLIVVCCFLAFLTGCRDHRKMDLDVFNKANAAYKQGNYLKAVEYYQQIRSEGFTSLAVEYNLGNAFLKMGQLGRAMASYERARRLQPRDSDLKANIEFAKSKMPMPSPSERKNAVFIHLKDVTFDEIVAIVVGLGIAVTALILAGLFLRWRLAKTAVWIGLLSLLLIFHIFALVAKLDDLQESAVVLTSTDVRYEPEDNATTHFTAGTGWIVRILKESSGWVKIQRPDGLEGWLPRKKIEKI